MKQKLISYFGDELVINNVHGRSDVVTVKETAANILQQFKDSPQTDDEEAEKRKIVRAAARLIKADKRTLTLVEISIRILLNCGRWKRVPSYTAARDVQWQVM